MEQLTIKTSTNTYNILVGEGLRFKLDTYIKKKYSTIFIITDENVAKLYLNDVRMSLKAYKLFQYIIPAGEKAKSMEQYEALQTAAIKNGLDRNSLIIALGGGVVGDLAGFVAATFMRGIDYIQIPTTILAHDSSVGGKVAINHPFGKNLIGSFYPPAAVIYDIDTLSSLSDKETRSGYAELIKEGLIDSNELFERMIQVNLNKLKNDELQEHVLLGIKVKAEIVEADEKEQGIRSYLNLGHTFAHALEAELGYGVITHGEAVAIGLLFSLHVSEGVFNKELPYETLKEWLKDNHYPLQSILFDTGNILNRMKSDKKSINQRIRMVLLKAPGQLVNYEILDEDMLKFMQTFKERLV